ncbi:MAG: hypothetical protein JHC95_23270 [Solirubrobacteraceae bacterium]|nr:hypothetical protein [Solirubrobacteraceae bacterium]
MLTRVARTSAWALLGAFIATLAAQLEISITATLIGLWFAGTIGVLVLITWRAHHRDEQPRLGLLWDERPD